MLFMENNAEAKISSVKKKALTRRHTCTNLPVEVGEFEVEEATGEAAEAQVRTEARRAGEQRVGVHSGPLEVRHPRLMATQTRDRTCC